MNGLGAVFIKRINLRRRKKKELLWQFDKIWGLFMIFDHFSCEPKKYIEVEVGSQVPTQLFTN